MQVQSSLQASNNTGILNTCTRLWLTESEQATPVDSIKDVVRSSVKVPEFDKHLKKAGGHIGRNLVEITITIKMKAIVRKPLMIKKEVLSIIFWVFGMTRPGIEPQSPGLLANSLPTRLMLKNKRKKEIYLVRRKIYCRSVFRLKYFACIRVSFIWACMLDMIFITGWNDKIVALKKTTLQLNFKSFIEKIYSGNLIT